MSPEVPAGPFPTARSWPEGEQIFWADKRWLGADNAYTVALGGNRTLWLFADSFVSDPPGPRTDATAVYGNTIAIMTGLDPSNAAMEFHWGTSTCGATTFFPPLASDNRAQRLMWPGHGIRLDAGLLLFFQVVDVTAEGGGQDPPGNIRFIGWTARLVTNYEDEPPRWIVHELDAPQNPYGIVVGSAQVLVSGDHLYAYSSNPREPINAYLARWPRKRAELGDLADPEWWCGSHDGWVPQSNVRRTPSVVLKDAKTEFTVHPDPVHGGFVQVQGSDYLSARLIWRRAETMVGPWSEPVAVYDPPERALEDVALYAFKVHPHLQGGDLVASYVALPLNRERLLSDDRLYRPRIVRLELPK